ncbi:MAG: hypothetical protein LBM27_04175 [Lactobacillaceae bacterium]|jgi:hypothetical protein|nr:hypothetical protein [Lactobacillaceae bacterium]
MWKFKGKNIYYVDSEISIGINRLNNRVDELGGNRVTLSPEIRRKSGVIDVVVINDYTPGKFDNLPKGLREKAEKQQSPMQWVSMKEFANSMGYNPDERFVNWEIYPNFDPWKLPSEPVKLWDDAKIALAD